MTASRRRGLPWLYEPAAHDQDGRHAPRLLRFLPSLLFVLVAALAVCWLMFVGFARLIGFEVSPISPTVGAIPPDCLFDITRAAATAAGVLAGVFAIVYAYRKQKVQEAAGKREDSLQLSQRYQDAAEQLGHAKGAVRLAGIYAMSRLADDWPEQRQQCVDVLCAYVRMPASTEDVDLERVIRRAVFDEVLLHTRTARSDSRSWSALRLDFSGARIEDLRADSNLFENLILDRAQFHGQVDFGGSELTGFLSMSSPEIFGQLSIAFLGPAAHVYASGARIHKGAQVSMTHEVEVAAMNRFARYSFRDAVVDEGGELTVALSPGAKKRSFDLSGSIIAGRLAIYGRGEEMSRKAVDISNITTVGGGRVGFQDDLIQAEGIISPAPKPSSTLSLMHFSVGPWEVLDDDD